MDLNEYQKIAAKTSVHKDKRTLFMCSLLGLNGEIGEVTEIIKKNLRLTTLEEFDPNTLDKRKLIDEMGDVLWYISALASSLNIDLNQIAEYNVYKLQQRYSNNGIDNK